MWGDTTVHIRLEEGKLHGLFKDEGELQQARHDEYLVRVSLGVRRIQIVHPPIPQGSDKAQVAGHAQHGEGPSGRT